MHTREEVCFDLQADMRTDYGPDLFRSGIAVGENSTLLFGPYATLGQGKWRINVSGHIDPGGHCYVDAAAESGCLILGGAPWSGNQCQFEIECSFPVNGFEVRIYGRSGSFVRVDGVSVERRIDSRRKRAFSFYERMGLSLYLDSTSLVDRAIIDKGSWDEPHIAYLRENAFRCANSSRDLVFLDIGSYFGIYSLVMARTNLFSKIVAFEADSLNFRQLCANLLANDPDCLIEPRYIAVSDSAGEVMFESSLDHPDGNRGGVGINELGTLACVDKRLEKKDKIDSLVPLEGRTIFAKIDVEGHELRVLSGMERTIAQNKVFIQVETFFQLPELERIMQSMGCRLINRIDDDYFFTNIESS